MSKSDRAPATPSAPKRGATPSASKRGAAPGAPKRGAPSAPKRTPSAPKLRVAPGAPKRGAAPEEIAAALEKELRAAGTLGRAVQEKRYLKSALEHFGVPVPEVRRRTLAALRAVKDLTREEVIALARRLWSRPVHELRSAAAEVLKARAKLLVAEDATDVLEPLLRESKTWALVDTLSAEIGHVMLERFPKELAGTLDRWAKDDDFWVRRSALLALLGGLRRGGGDFERFSRYADAMLEEKEFFIRKAIGWILRETSKKRPELVAEWVAPRAARMSGLTLREATRQLPPKLQAAARREA